MKHLTYVLCFLAGLAVGLTFDASDISQRIDKIEVKQREITLETKELGERCLASRKVCSELLQTLNNKGEQQ